MRPIVIQRHRLRSAQQDLESAAADITAAAERVEPPAADYPWHLLVEEGVRLLLDDARLMAKKCTRVAEAVHDSMADFDDLDGYVAMTAQLDHVSPHVHPVVPPTGSPTVSAVPNAPDAAVGRIPDRPPVELS